MFTMEQLLSPEFDEIAYLRHALHLPSSSIPGEQSRLSACMDQMKQNIQSLLTDNVESMIEQVHVTHKAQREVALVRQSVNSLSNATTRLRLTIEEPYLAIRSKIHEMINTNRAMRLLRSVQEFLFLTARLQEQVSGSDIIRAARTLVEIETLISTVDLSGVEVVDSRLTGIEKAASTIRTRVHDLLRMQDLMRTDLEKQDKGAATLTSGIVKTVVDVSTAVQCFVIFGNLSRVVQGFMAERKREVTKSIMRELDVEAIAEAVNQCLQGQDWRTQELLPKMQAVVLQKIQNVLLVVLQHTQCVLLLWCVLLHRDDPATHCTLLYSLDAPEQLLADYWIALAETLRVRLLDMQKHPQILAALTSGYPRYYALIQGFLSSSGGIRGMATCAAGTVGSSSSLTEAITAVNFRHCGMGDYMDLTNVVDARMRQVKAGVSVPETVSSASNRHSDSLQQVWMTQVTEDIHHRFATQMADRHRERLNVVLSKLSALTPPTSAIGSQAVKLAVTDLRRPSVPPQASALDVISYTKVALHDLYSYRDDGHSMDAAMECILTCVSQLHEKLQEASRKCPLPPLPSVTASITRAQLMHVCIANGCTVLVNDLSNMLAVLPEENVSFQLADGIPSKKVTSSPEGHSANAASCNGCFDNSDQDYNTLHRLVVKRKQLMEMLHSLHSLTEASSRPFVNSAVVVFSPIILKCVEAASSSSENPNHAVVRQLEDQIRQFHSRFFYLFDARMPGWPEVTRGATDVLLARFLTYTAVASISTHVSAQAAQRALQRCLEEICPVVLSVFGLTDSIGMARSTLLLRTTAKQMSLFYSTTRSTPGGEAEDVRALNEHDGIRLEEMWLTLRPLYPLLSLVLLIQYYMAHCISKEHQSSTAALFKVSPESLQMAVEAGLLRFCGAQSEYERQNVDLIEQTAQDAFKGMMSGRNDAVASAFVEVWTRISANAHRPYVQVDTI